MSSSHAFIGCAIKKDAEPIFALEYLEDFSYDENQLLGAGTCGVVYLGKYKQTVQAAVKVFYRDAKADIFAMQEVELTRLFRSPGVIKSFGHCKNPLCHVMEKGDCTLAELMQKKPKMSLSQRIEFAVQVCATLQMIHAKNYVYGDLNSNNVLIVMEDSQYQTKLTDFECTHLGDEKTLLPGTLNYMAPEVVCSKQTTFASDVYNFGMLLFELILNNDEIFSRVSMAQFSDEKISAAIEAGVIRGRVISELRKMERSEKSCLGLSSAIQLIKSCIDNDATKRPALAEIAKCLDRIITTLNPNLMHLKIQVAEVEQVHLDLQFNFFAEEKAAPADYNPIQPLTIATRSASETLPSMTK